MIEILVSMSLFLFQFVSKQVTEKLQIITVWTSASEVITLWRLLLLFLFLFFYTPGSIDPRG